MYHSYLAQIIFVVNVLYKNKNPEALPDSSFSSKSILGPQILKLFPFELSDQQIEQLWNESLEQSLLDLHVLFNLLQNENESFSVLIKAGLY